MTFPPAIHADLAKAKSAADLRKVVTAIVAALATDTPHGWICARCGIVWRPNIMSCTCKPAEAKP